MRREQTIATVFGVLVVGVIAAILLGSPSTETEVYSSVTLGDPQAVGPAEALVVGKQHSGGRSIFGLRFGRTTYRIDVQLYAGEGCFEQVDFGDPWPAAIEACASGVPVEGEISGGGTASTGESIVSVLVEVSKGCYEAATRGDSWPPETAACIPEE